MKTWLNRTVRRALALMVPMLCLALSVAAQSLSVPSVIGDKMVLQRNSTARLWGWGQPLTEVTVKTSWNKEPIVVKVDELGQWLAEVPTFEAAEKQKITISNDYDKLSFSDIMIGEVWICAGQSNMRFGVEKTIDVLDALKKPNKNIRLYNVPQKSSMVPMDDIYDTEWTTTSSTYLATFSAVGYVFGDRLQRELDVPVGLINASYGGTLIESWMPEEAIVANKVFLDGVNKAKKDNARKWKNKPRHNTAAQYNQMVHPYVNTTVAGVIWYQGCHNVNTTLAHYDQLLESFIESWRERFRNPELPFYVVQITPHTWAGINGALMREKQAMVANEMDHVEIIATIDQNDRTGDIHPRNKRVVGERLAAAALGEHYGKDVDFRAPQMSDVEREEGQLRIKFSNAEKGLMCPDKKIVGFQVSDMKGDYYLAEAKIEGSEVVVWSEKVASPNGVRYCFDECEGNLFCKNGLPVVPFRSDFDNGAKYSRSIYEELSDITVTVKYRGCFIGKMGNGAHPWSNKNWVMGDAIEQMDGWDYLQPKVLEANEFSPKLSMTAHGDGYVYVFARNIIAMYEREGWEVVPCSGVGLKDLDKKGRSRGTIYLCRHAVKKGETVTIPSTDEMFSVVPVAKEIIYE